MLSDEFLSCTNSAIMEIAISAALRLPIESPTGP